MQKLHPIYTQYLVSDTGEITNVNTGKVLKQNVNDNGYLLVTITITKGEYKRYRVHRLVAETFLENPNNFSDVNHKNGIKTDNNLYNLEWCTRSYNIKHAKAMGLNTSIGQTHVMTDLTNKDVEEVCFMLEKGVPIKIISDITNICKQTIVNIKNGRTWEHISKGYNITTTKKPRLTDESVIGVYLDYWENKLSKKDIISKYGISRKTVERIVNKKTHKELIINYLNDYRNHT